MSRAPSGEAALRALAPPSWRASLQSGTARAAPARVPRGFVLGTLFACLVLQRFALPVGDLKVHAATLIVFALAAWGLVSGSLGLDRRRVGFLIALVGLALFSILVRMNLPVVIAWRSSLPSLAYWLLVTAVATLSFARPAPEEWFFHRVTLWLAAVAAAGVLQFLAQFAGAPLFSFRGIVPDSLLVEELFAVQLSLASGVMRANGFFLVEPSVFSQMMAIGLIVETLYFRRPAFLALFLMGLLSAVSGTGWLVLTVFVAQIGFGFGVRGLTLALGLALSVAMALTGVVLWLPDIAEGLFARIGEFWLIGTSGYERFVTPFLVIRDLVKHAPWTLLTGLGPGSVEQLSLPYVYHVNTPLKLLGEYGVGGLLFYLATLVSADRTPRQRALVLPLLVLLLVAGGYQQFTPVLFLVILILTVARLQEAEPVGPAGANQTTLGGPNTGLLRRKPGVRVNAAGHEERADAAALGPAHRAARKRRE